MMNKLFIVIGITLLLTVLACETREVVVSTQEEVDEFNRLTDEEVTPMQVIAKIDSPPPPSDYEIEVVKPPTRVLITAVDQEKTEIVQQHMDAGTDPDEYSRPLVSTMVTLKNLGAEGAYSLHLAVLKENEDIVRILLDNGGTVDIRAKNENKPTPLHLAAYYCLEDMVSLLIEYGSSVHTLDSDNTSAYDYALLGQQVGIDMIEEKREQESDPSRLTSSAFGSDKYVGKVPLAIGAFISPLVPGCIGKTEEAYIESQVSITDKMDGETMLQAEKNLNNLLTILKGD